MTRPDLQLMPDAANTFIHRTPRAAYIHVPFCRHRCGYCNFTLVAGRDELIDDYLRAVDLELNALATSREVDTLYFGGGTPSHLSCQQFRTLATTVLKWFPLVTDKPSHSEREQSEVTTKPSPSGRGQGEGALRYANSLAAYEWTVEANPVDVTPEWIKLLVALGVTRISLGGQSFNVRKLKLLERDHSGAEIALAARLIQQAGMQVVFDLIFAAPGETLAEWQDDLESAIAISPDHFSVYGLTIERGTAFWSRRQQGTLIEVDEESQRAMYAHAIDRLVAAGYEHYEVSNFARPGCRSRHNQVYWAGEGYYAAGPGAARYVNGIRETNHRSTTTYLKHVLAGESPVAEREQLTPEARARELLVFSLRRIAGISRTEFRKRTGYDIDGLVGQPLKKFVDLRLLDDDGETIRLTREGLFVSDAIWPEIL